MRVSSGISYIILTLNSTIEFEYKSLNEEASYKNQ